MTNSKPSIRDEQYTERKVARMSESAFHWAPRLTLTRVGRKFAVTALFALIGLGLAQPLTITIAVKEPTTLNFNWDLDLVTPYILVNIQNKLFDTTYDNATIPVLAETWSLSEDARAFTVKVHEGVLWHDGSELTAADVAYSYTKALEVKGPASPLLSMVSSVTAVDSYTVRFDLSEPSGNFVETLANYYGVFIVPQALYDDGSDVRANPLNLAPPGTGPFKFVEWVPGSHIRLAANDDYFLGRPGVDQLVFRFMDHLPTVVAALEAGEIDSTQLTIPFGDIPRLQQLGGLQVTVLPKTNPSWLGFNLRREPFSDVRVRRAIAHAIDRDLLSDIVFGGLAPAEHTAWLSVVAWANNPEARQPDYDPELAEKLLDEAGLKRGSNGIRFSMTIATFRGSSLWGMPESADFIRDQLRSIGVDAEVRLMESATWSDMVNVRHDFDVAIGGGLRGPDPNDFAIFVSADGPRNAMGYENDRVEELFKIGRTVGSQEERRAAYFELEQIIADDLPLLTLIATVDPYVNNLRFEGYPWQDGYRDIGMNHYFGNIRPVGQ